MKIAWGEPSNVQTSSDEGVDRKEPESVARKTPKDVPKLIKNKFPQSSSPKLRYQPKITTNDPFSSTDEEDVDKKPDLPTSSTQEPEESIEFAATSDEPVLSTSQSFGPKFCFSLTSNYQGQPKQSSCPKCSPPSTSTSGKISKEKKRAIKNNDPFSSSDSDDHHKPPQPEPEKCFEKQEKPVKFTKILKRATMENDTDDEDRRPMLASSQSSKPKFSFSLNTEKTSVKPENPVVNVSTDDKTPEITLEKPESLKPESQKKSENSEKAEESDGAKKLKHKLKKVKSAKRKTKLRFEYEWKKMEKEKKKKEKIARKKEEAERKTEGRRKFKKIDRSSVQKPTKLIRTAFPQRPFPENMCNDDREAHGSAFELLDAMFPGNAGNGNRSSKTEFQSWHANNDAIKEYLEKSRNYHETLLHTFPRPSNDEIRRQKQKKTLESLEEIIRLMHFRRHDVWIQKAVDLMTFRSMFYSDEEGGLRMFREDDFSMIWSDFLNDEKLDILEQRRPGWMLRPVFVDGFSLLSIFFPDLTTFPKLPVKILLEVLMHFLLDGHQVTILLPEVFENNEKIDDVAAFNFLIENKLIEFINSNDPKTLEECALGRAETTHGILVTTSEDVPLENAILCHPIVHQYSDQIEDFSFLTIFNGDLKELENSEDVEILEEDCENSKDVEDVGDLSRDAEDVEIPEDNRNSEGVNDVEDVENSENMKEPEGNLEDSEEEESSEICINREEDSESSEEESNDVNINRYQSFVRKCRLYSLRDIDELTNKINPTNYQLTIRDQVFLICSLAQLTDFHLRPARLIRAFLVIINQYSPDLIPLFMAKNTLYDISDALENIRDHRNPTFWPIFKKYV